MSVFFFFNDTATTEIYTLSLHDALPIYSEELQRRITADPEGGLLHRVTTHSLLAALSNPLMSAIIRGKSDRSEEHTSELQSHSDLVCRLLLEKKKHKKKKKNGMQ